MYIWRSIPSGSSSSSGRWTPFFTRVTSRSTFASSHTTWASLSASAQRLAPASTTPPAAATTAGSSSPRMAIRVAVSIARNAASPSDTQISRTVRPVRSSMSSSESSNGRWSFRARTRPTDDLPAPIMPTSTMCLPAQALTRARPYTPRRCERTRPSSLRRTCVVLRWPKRVQPLFQRRLPWRELR